MKNENKFNRNSFFPIIVIPLLFLLFYYLYSIESTKEFIYIILYDFIKKNIGHFSSVIAIFIGIHVSTILFIATAKPSSIFYNLTRKELIHLIRIIKNAFFLSLSYLLSIFPMSFILSFTDSPVTIYTITCIVITLLILSFILNSIFGIYIFLSLYTDIFNFFKNKEKELKREKNIDSIVQGLSVFLDDYEKQRRKNGKKN